MLARIMPARVGFDIRTFKCSKCDLVHEVLVETDAFTSHSASIGSGETFARVVAHGIPGVMPGHGELSQQELHDLYLTPLCRIFSAASALRA